MTVHTHAHTHARTHAHKHARTHACMHARTSRARGYRRSNFAASHTSVESSRGMSATAWCARCARMRAHTCTHTHTRTHSHMQPRTHACTHACTCARTRMYSSSYIILDRASKKWGFWKVVLRLAPADGRTFPQVTVLAWAAFCATFLFLSICLHTGACLHMRTCVGAHVLAPRLPFCVVHWRQHYMTSTLW